MLRAINYSINAYIEVFDQITGALACVGLVLMIWLYQALKFRNRAGAGVLISQHHA